MAERGPQLPEEMLHFLTAAVDAALDGIALLDPDVRFQYANEAFCRLVGHERCEDLLGRPAADFLSEDDLGLAADHVAEARDQGRPEVFEMLLHMKDGRTIPVEISISTLRHDDGRIHGSLVIVRDATERKQVEATLKFKNALLESQSEASIDGILVVDQDGRMISHNRRFVEIWGIPEEVIASGSDERALESVMDKLVDPEAFLARVRYLYEHREETSSDEIPLRDGRTLDRYSAPVIGLDGTYYGRVWYFHDLTKRKQTEQALQRARDDAQRAHEELREEQERSEEIGRAIQQALLLSPPPTESADFETAALAVPSSPLAGDFCEFLLHPNRCLDIISGDVMGKGPQAALFSAGAKSEFLRGLVHLLVGSRRGDIPQPADIVNRVHHVLTPQLLSLESFVTLSYVRFDALAGKVTLVDCGSTKLIRRAGDTGRIDCLSGFNLPLGTAASEVYAEAVFDYAANDMFVLYSDGVTEARNSAGEEFGLERLCDLIAAQTDLDAQRLADAIKEAVKDFVGSRPLSDDLTCVVLKMMEAAVADGGLSGDELRVTSSPKELRRIRAFVRGYCERHGGRIKAPDLDMLELAVSEAASNIMRHAYHGRTDRRILVAIDATEEGLSVKLTHDGEPFAEGEQVSDPLADGASESGFGLFIMRQAVDRVDYGEDELGRQYIRLSKRVSPDYS